MIRALCDGFLNTPPLWRNEQFGIQQFEFPSVDFDTLQTKPLPTNLRLGHQMEYVFKQLVEASGAYTVAVHNLPITKGGITKGEIDFVLKKPSTKQLIHVELTYKFYLIDPTISEPIHQLIGPNRRDTFFAKMEKIKHKQFPLLHTEEGTKAVQERDIAPSSIEQQCCFKAQLFEPYGSKTNTLGAFNRDCLAGYWLRFNDFNTADFGKAQFYMPTKSEWVIAPHDQVAWKSHSEILSEVGPSLLQERAPMLWVKKSDTEFEKLFVVWWL